MRASIVWGALALPAVLFAWGQNKKDDLTLDDLYPEKPLTGKTARGMSWSSDDRYVAYVWNPYDDKGSDIWVYDTVEKKATRITSIDMMAPFDRDTLKTKERYQREKDDENKRRGLSGDELKKFEEEVKKRKEKEERTGDYSGISEFEWSHTGHDLLFTFKGDVYRLTVGSDTPVRLTKTKDPESNLQWTNADDGFFFRRGENVFRVRFNSAVIEQLNPDLPQNMKMGWYSISPDETKLAIASGRTTGQDRQVTYIVYRGRFAEARTTPRGVADDVFNEESYLYLYDLNDDPVKNPANDGKPWQIYFWPAGKEYGQTSLSPEPWSADSKKFVFSTWKRDQKEFQVVVADVVSKKTDTVYTETLKGGHTTPGRAVPTFTPDGSKIVINTDKSGYMHLWVVDPAAKTATQLTKGDFEVEPIKMSKDGTSVFVSANPDNAARVGIYKASMADGKLTPFAVKPGNYDSESVSHDTAKVAATFRSWNELVELYLSDGQTDSKITASHPDGFWKLQKIKPTEFSFKNRYGDTVYGYMYLPLDYKKGDKRPLWIYTYGGPLNARGRDVVDGGFNSFNMYLAYKYGYITCTIDPRGMSGYGGKFESANWESPGKAQVQDLSDGVKWFEENYGIDRDKVGINGWSFGGFQTQMCMYTAPDVFKLGIAGAGPTEWQNYNTWYTGGVIGFSRLGNPNDLDKYSLTKLAKNLKGPLMLLHGMEDTNVLFQDTVKVYQALLQAGKGPLVELVLDPTGSHGLGGDIKTKDRYRIYEGFLQRRWGAYKAKR
ncbi:MAG: prolyl oligopeptidase family serine peptidase [Fimbriimonadales bacterium]